MRQAAPFGLGLCGLVTFCGILAASARVSAVACGLARCGDVAHGGPATVAGPRSLARIGVNTRRGEAAEGGYAPDPAGRSTNARAPADDRADFPPRCRC